MLPPLGGWLRHFSLLVLPCVALGAVSSTAGAQLNHEGQLSAVDRRVPGTLRGGLHTFRADEPRLQHLRAAFAGLQASRNGRIGKAKRKRSKLHRLIHSQETRTRSQTHAAQGICRGMKLKWWIKIKKKCTKAYGADSKWDRNKMDGQCSKAWQSCNTGFYAVCCTQPLGPKNLQAYCQQQELVAEEPEAVAALLQDPQAQAGEKPEGDKSQGDTAQGDKPKGDKAAKAEAADKACVVQKKVDEVNQVVNDIKHNIKLMQEDPPSTPPPPVPEVIKSTIVVPPPPPPIAGPSPGPAPGMAPVMAPPPPSGIIEKQVIMVPPPPPPTPRPLSSRCDKLAELTRQAVEKVHAVKAWANGDGIRDDDDEDDDDHAHKSIGKDLDQADPGNQEAKDPDLAVSVKGVLKIGKKLKALLKMGEFCTKQTPVDDEDDDSVEDDLEKDPTKPWNSDWDKDDDEEEEDEVPVTKVNETAVMGLLEWESDMHNAVEKFETEVHPHGFKWWRYRYQYTIVESFALAFSVLMLFFVMWLLHGVSFFENHKFYKTGLPQRFYRYAWIYFVFHAAALMVLVSTAYMLYVPWGKTNIFNLFAETLHDYVDGHACVPFMGYSWLYMILDVQFQLFATFALYSLFIVMVANNYIKALRDWKALSEDPDATCKDNLNARTFRHLERIVKHRIETTPAFKQIFRELNLRVSGVDGLDVPGWNDFKLHVYLTEGLGKSMEYLVQVSLTTSVALAISALLVASLAHHYQVAFMYFLPGFVVVCFVIFGLGYGASRYFRALSDNADHINHTNFTVHAFCRAVQVLLYCLFYSFARLLLSNDIFEQFKTIYLSALVGLLGILILLALFAGEVIKETTCSLILPPHLPAAVFRAKLTHIVHWHLKERCHECGAEQPHIQASFSKEWAGKKPVGDRALGTAPGESVRLYSWRG